MFCNSNSIYSYIFKYFLHSYLQQNINQIHTYQMMICYKPRFFILCNIFLPTKFFRLQYSIINHYKPTYSIPLYFIPLHILLTYKLQKYIEMIIEYNISYTYILHIQKSKYPIST